MREAARVLGDSGRRGVYDALLDGPLLRSGTRVMPAGAGAEELAEHGRQLVAAGKPIAALAVLARALATAHEDDADVLALLGRARGLACPGDTTAGVDVLRRALRHDPTCELACVYLGEQLAVAPGGAAEARECFRTALRHNPECAAASEGLRGLDRGGGPGGGERIRDTTSAWSVVNTAGLAFLDTLHRWVQGGLSGGIEWQDEKRRRLVFVEGDTLLAVQSNLRSESMERVVETGAAADLISATRQVRLRGLLTAPTGVILVHPGVEPPAREPVSLALALWEVADALPALDADHYPVAVPSGFGRLRSLPWSSELLQYLQELDGTREVQDVEDFAPEPGPVVVGAGRRAALGRD